MFPTQKEARLLIVYHKDGNFPNDLFLLINENLRLAELGRLVFLDVEGLSIQYLIYSERLQKGLNYLDSIRHLGIRHTTMKLSPRRYKNIVNMIKEGEKDG